MYLLIDDCRDYWCDVVAKNAKAAKEVLAGCGRVFDSVGFDHDLGLGESGYDVLVWAIEEDLLPNHVQVVTSNPVGRSRMVAVLVDAGYKTTDRTNFYKGVSDE
jgi:hypothetical protein